MIENYMTGDFQMSFQDFDIKKSFQSDIFPKLQDHFCRLTIWKRVVINLSCSTKLLSWKSSKQISRYRNQTNNTDLVRFSSIFESFTDHIQFLHGPMGSEVCFFEIFAVDTFRQGG